MARLTDFLERGERVMLSGPYGTEIAERNARDVADSPQINTGILNVEQLGAGCSALLSERGQEHLRKLTGEYVDSVPHGQALMLVLDTFRLPKQVLETAALNPGIDRGLPSRGLDLHLIALEIARDALQGRNRKNTIIAASVGTPFDCYKGEETSSDPLRVYLPQTFAVTRFCHDVNTLLFETIPSYRGALGAAEAFTEAHKRLSLTESSNGFRNAGIISYWGDVLQYAQRLGVIGAFAPSYDPRTKAFGEQTPEKEYILSLCLEANAGLHDGRKRHGRTMDVSDALHRFYDEAEKENLILPVGFGINCNSPEITERALDRLADDVRDRVVSIHPNATRGNDPRKYAELTHRDAIPDGEYVATLARIAKAHDIGVVGGCCGTHPGTMSQLYVALR